MENMTWYKQDNLGLRTLNEKGKITKVTLNEKHVAFTGEDVDKLFIPFLKK